MTRPPPPLTEEISPNTFLTTVNTNLFSHSSSSSPDTDFDSAPIFIFFIPGNPGLVAHYQLFLSLLATQLGSTSSGALGSAEGGEERPRETGEGREGNGKRGFIICGRSLGGFEVGGVEEEGKSSRLYGLTQQIEFVEKQLEEGVRRSGIQKQQNAKVILVGHSAGTYIAMEILRRNREREKVNAKSKGDDAEMEIIGGVMLFPTVVDIAKSPSGKNLTLLLCIPYLGLLVSLLAKIAVSILPDRALNRIVSAAMGNPREDAVDTTMSFLKSKSGVQQTIHMAADELRDISVDKWNDEVWGISRPETSSRSLGRPPAKLVFYFGRNDHWVAEQTREDIIRARGPDAESAANGVEGPKMVVCEDSVPHAFSIGHNDIMAGKVAGFIQDMVKER